MYFTKFCAGTHKASILIFIGNRVAYSLLLLPTGRQAGLHDKKLSWQYSLYKIRIFFETNLDEERGAPSRCLVVVFIIAHTLYWGVFGAVRVTERMPP